MAFGRRIELYVGKENNESFKVTNLKIEFEIVKTKIVGNKTNNAKIKVYNPNNETSKQLCTSGNHLIIKAGYEDEIISTILIGSIVKGNKHKDGSNTVVEIEVADSRNKIMTSQISVSYAKDTSLSTVVKGLTDEIGLTVKGIENLPSEKFEHGYSYIGMATDSLKEVLIRYGYTYTIQNEMIYIYKEGNSIENLGLRLSKETGLITLPSHTSDKSDSSKITENSSNQWTFKTLLFPQLMPGAVCKVESSTLNANILIEESRFTGNNFDGDFIVEVRGVER